MAWALFDERLAPLAMLGMMVCVVGVALVNWRVPQPAAAPAPK
jgi:drug/metabolite transporter (DMT)-like permease